LAASFGDGLTIWELHVGVATVGFVSTTVAVEIDADGFLELLGTFILVVHDSARGTAGTLVVRSLGGSWVTAAEVSDQIGAVAVDVLASNLEHRCSPAGGSHSVFVGGHRVLHGVEHVVVSLESSDIGLVVGEVDTSTLGVVSVTISSSADHVDKLVVHDESSGDLIVIAELPEVRAGAYPSVWVFSVVITVAVACDESQGGVSTSEASSRGSVVTADGIPAGFHLIHHIGGISHDSGNIGVSLGLTNTKPFVVHIGGEVSVKERVDWVGTGKFQGVSEVLLLRAWAGVGLRIEVRGSGRVVHNDGCGGHDGSGEDESSKGVHNK
jgi:hypothetical protein